MGTNRKGSHNIYQLQSHLVFCTKYRYKVLNGDVQKRCRDLIRQSCDSLDIEIVKGVVSSDHVHLHIDYPAKLSISEITRRIKGRSARKLLQEYAHLKKRYWGGHFWGIGYGCWSVGKITEEILKEYIEHHRNRPNQNDSFFLE